MRVGVRKENSVRPFKFSVGSADHAAQVIKKARMEGTVRSACAKIEHWKREKLIKKLVKKVKMKRIAEPNKVFNIKNENIISSM